MPSLTELRENRAAKIAEMSSLVGIAEKAGRDLDSNEAKRFDALKDEVRGLDASISRREALDEMERRAPAEPLGNRDMARELRAYSLAKAVQEASAGRLTGLEAEVHAELSRGREARGVMIPTELLLGSEGRSQTVGTGSAGGFTVATSLAPLADRFRPALRVEALGATVLRNLAGNVDLPKLSGSGSTSWVSENANATRSAATFAKVAMTPRTITGEYRVSRRLMLQSAAAIEDVLRRDIGFMLAQGLDRAAIQGGGTNEPTGILDTAGVEKVTTETAFSDTTANLIAALDLDDVTGTRAFLTNPDVMRTVRKVKGADGHVIPAAELFHGERVEVSTQVPDDIGTANDKSALIYGQWSELIIGYWSAVDILVNPYHANVASNGGSLIHAFLDADVAVRHVEAFAFAEI